MGAPPDIRPRVLRLLRGERRSDDVFRLCQWLRFRTDGRAPMLKDIADFVGHKDERDQGIAWERGVDSYNMWTCFLATSNTGNFPPPTLEQYKRAARSCFRAMGNDAARKRFKIGAKTVKSRLESALAKLDGVSGRKHLTCREPLSQVEEETFRYYLSFLISEPAITQEGLIGQLIGRLLHEGVLEESEVEAFKDVGCFVCIYAMAQMHGSRLVENDQEIATLVLSARDGKLSIDAVRPMGLSKVTFSLFSTECDAEMWSDPAIFERGLAEGAVELSAEGKLVAL